MREADARYALLDAVRRLDRAGLNVNASGNASVRVGEHLLVTPSGIPATALRPDDMVLVDLEGRPVDDEDQRSGRVPTSEWRIHTALAAGRPDAGAIVHTHAPESTAAAVIGRSVPAVHYVVARFGDDHLACAPYATYGTEELAAHVVATLGEQRTACLMANHGAIVLAADLATAVALALDVEWLCAVHRRAVALGEPVVLPSDEIGRVAERFRRYGLPER